MRKLHVTHSDLDGCLPILLDKYFEEDFTYTMSLDYKDYEKEGFNYEALLKYDSITFTDFSPNQHLLDLILSTDIELIIIDHHATFYELHKVNLEKLKERGNIQIVFDNDKSGTMLYFEYLKEKHPDTEITKGLEQLVFHVNNYDLYKTDLPTWETSLSLNRLLWKNYGWGFANTASPRKFEKYIKLLEVKSNSDDDFKFNMYEKNAIEDARHKEMDAYKRAIANMLIRTDERGHKFGLFRIESKVSIVAHNILKNFKQLDYVLVFNTYVKDQVKLSARAKKGFNLLELNYLKGHAEASGSEGFTQRKLNQLWRGANFYELGYREDYVQDHTELEIIKVRY